MAGQTVMGTVNLPYPNQPFFVHVYHKIYGNGEYHYGPKSLTRWKKDETGRMIYRLRVTIKPDYCGASYCGASICT